MSSTALLHFRLFACTMFLSTLWPHSNVNRCQGRGHGVQNGKVYLSQRATVEILQEKVALNITFGNVRSWRYFFGLESRQSLKSPTEQGHQSLHHLTGQLV